MKKTIEDFFKHFFASPLLPLLIILCSVSAMMLTSDEYGVQESASAEYVHISPEERPTACAVAEEETTTAASHTTTSSALDTAHSKTETAVTTTVTATVTSAAETKPETDAPAERPQVSDYTVFAGEDSPNSGYYQDHLAIVGDSIAYGFNAYGYIPNEHNIAKESLGLWNMGRYTFDMGGGAMNLIDAAAYADPALIYLSIGMNDIPGTSPEAYGADMFALAQQLADAVSDTTIVVGAITPVSDDNDYTSNDVIRAFNSSLEYTVNTAGDPRIYFFNTYSVLADPNTLALASNCAGADGLHLTGQSYGIVLNSLFNYLDMTDAMNRIQAHDTRMAQEEQTEPAEQEEPYEETEQTEQLEE